MVHSIEELVPVTNLAVHDDDRGCLFETIRSDDPNFIMFGQSYVSKTLSGVVRGFHYHDMQTDHFTVISGRAIFCFWTVPGCRDEDDHYDTGEYLAKVMKEHKARWDDELSPRSYDHILNLGAPWFKRIVVSGDRPVRIDVPPGVAHGYCAIGGDMILLNTVSEMYNADDPDEHRLSWDLFGTSIWAIENK